MPFTKKQVLKLIKTASIIIIIAYLPLLFFVGIIVDNHWGAETYIIYYLIVNALCGGASIVLCCFEVIKMGGVKAIGRLKTLSLFMIYVSIPLLFASMVIGIETAGNQGGKIVALVWGFLVIGELSCFFIGGAPKYQVKADRFPCPNGNYLAWKEDFINKAKDDSDYSFLQEREVEHGQITLLIQRNSTNDTLNCIAISKTDEITDSFVGQINDVITEMLMDYKQERKIRDTVNMIGIFCVDRVSNDFYKLVNSSMQQGIKNGRLVVGISFGGKQVYIAKHNGGAFQGKYNDLRRQFLDIAGFGVVRKSISVQHSQ